MPQEMEGKEKENFGRGRKKEERRADAATRQTFPAFLPLFFLSFHRILFLFAFRATEEKTFAPLPFSTPTFPPSTALNIPGNITASSKGDFPLPRKGKPLTPLSPISAGPPLQRKRKITAAKVDSHLHQPNE